MLLDRKSVMDICAGIALTGCATIFSSGPTRLDFISNPEGAEVWVSGRLLGTTPVMIELHANDQQIVTFRMDGCEDTTLPLQMHVQAGWVVLDILAGVIGVAIDAGTGEWKGSGTGLCPLVHNPPAYHRKIDLHRLEAGILAL